MAGRALRSRRSVSQESTAPQARSSRATRAAAEVARGNAYANPDVDNPSLPSVDTQQSFAYGSTRTPGLPRQLEAGPLGVTEMAATLDMGMRQAHDREVPSIEQADRASPEHQIVTRSQRRAARATGRQSASVSPTRQANNSRRVRSRQLTPDDQLLGSLREASEEAESSHERGNFSAVEGSSVSWITERGVLGTARPSGSGTARGSASNWPFPRRQSSFAGSEDPSETHVGNGRAQSSAAITAAVDVPRLGAASHPTSAAAMVGTPADDRTASDPTPISSPISPVFAANQQQRRLLFNVYSLLTIFLTLFAAFGVYTIGDTLRTQTQGLRLPFSFCDNQPTSSCSMDGASTAYNEAITKITSEVDRRLSDMAKDVSTLKEEWNKRLPYVKQAIHPPVDPLAPRRVNFLATGLGAVIDPYLTSPTKSSQVSFLHRFLRYGAGARQGFPPVAALTKWDDVGECWCAETHTGVSQLAVLLGRPIVPEEVIVEHIPRDETLDAGAAPRHMEMWVEYKDRSPTGWTSSFSDSISSSPPSPSDPSIHSPYDLPPSSQDTSHSESMDHSQSQYPPSSSSLSSLRETVLSTLRMTYPDEPETAYSDDPALGPAFFRVGRWQYDINGGHNIQRFMLDAVIDMPTARVERVVFRVKSTWGSDHACLYRLRLHGNL